MMKQVKTLLIAIVALFGFQTINAQAKVAHADVNEVMSKMPAVLDAQKQLQKLGETYNTEYKTMVDEYQAKIAKYDKEAATQTDAVNQSRQTEVQDMAKRIGDYQDNAQKELQKKQEELMKPLTEKVKASITKIGKAKGYQYVLNSSDQSLVLMADGPDLTSDIKKDLGF